jgi:hypothetical protein
MSTNFKRANVPLAAVYLFFARKRYLELAIYHGMAINLEAPDLRASYEKGMFPKKGWEISFLADVSADAVRLQKSMVSSFLLISVGAFLAAAFGLLSGNLNFQLPLNPVNALAFAGTFLVGWATLMELGGGLHTWKGESLHELLHPFLFKILFIPGVALLFMSLVLW